MKILLDAMGGDNAPDANIKGAVKAINQIEAEVWLIGKEEVSEKKTNSKTRKTLDNSNYVGIYTYSDGLETTLTLTKGYDAVFYIGDDNNKSYYLGKYQVAENKIVMYKIKIIDTTNLEETNLNDDIYFNIVNPNTITSIYGRNESIRLQKIDNSV